MGLKVIEGGNQWQCCELFKNAEDDETIVWTTCGISVADDEIILLDILFCPFCGTKLPEGKDTLLREAEEINTTLPDPEPEANALERWLR